MAGTRTTKFKIYKSEVGAEADGWGGRTNEGWNDVDALLGATATTGSANAYVLASGLTTALSAYVTGQSFLIIPNFTNTGAATINVDGLGAKNLYKRSGLTVAACAAGDVPSGVPCRIVYDGTQFVVTTAGAINRVAVQVFTGSGTYTPTSGMRFCRIRALGGGGGGGGVADSGGSGAAGGGGAGSLSEKWSTAADIGTSQTVTIGAAGTAGSSGNNNGGAGGDTSVGSICIGKGGSAGGGAAASSAGASGTGGVTGTGDVTSAGESGFAFGSNGTAYGTAAVAFSGGWGGSSQFGGGGKGGLNSVGVAATGYGAGGGGAASHNSGGARAGGAGSAGLVIIEEFI